MKIIANKSILHNNVTNSTFIANELDEKVQTGTRENDSHIEWMGDLNIPIERGSMKEITEEEISAGEAEFYSKAHPVTPPDSTNWREGIKWYREQLNRKS